MSGSETTGVGGDVRGFRQPGIGLGIGDIERRPIANGLGVRILGLEWLWVARSLGSVASVVDARERGEHDLIVRKQGQPTRVRP